MNQDELQQKLDRASRHYNDGQYDEAAAVWQGLLQEDPQNERAREGLQMVELLTQDFGAQAAGGGADAAATAVDMAQVQQAVQRVEELLDSGDTDAAREGVEVLLQIAPDNPAVQRCAARLEARADPSAYTEEQLSLARHYLMMEDRAASMEACRRVLSVDPDNDVAKELLSQARGDEAPPLQPAPGPPAATSELAPEVAADQPLGEEDLLTFDLDSLEDAGDLPVAPEPMEIELPPVAEAPVASADGDGGDAEQPIVTLLAQGDEKEAQGDLQGAIEIWSRVFILEDSNADAEARVDRVRRVLEEQGIRVDEIRFRAEDLMKAGNLAEARDEYQKVLEILPHHREAQEALQQIEEQLAGGAEATQAAGDDGEEIQAVPLALPEEPPEAAPEELELQQPVLLEPQPPAPRPREAAAPAVGQAPARSGPGRGLVLSMLVVGVVVLGVAGYVGWHILFPSDSGELQGLEPQPLDRTSAVPVAVELPADAAAPEPEPEVAEKPVVAPRRQRPLNDAEARALAKEVVQEGTRLFEDGDYVNALEQFREALDLDPGNFDAKDWETKTAAEVGRRELFAREIATIRAAVVDYDYESALRKLYRMEPPTEAGEAMVQRWTIVCWYNWGVLRLQGARLREAEEKFQEVLALQADDEEAANHIEIARRYRKRPVDPTFKNYTSRLTLRELD